MITTYRRLIEICEMPKPERTKLVLQHAPDITRIIAEQAHGAQLFANRWLTEDPKSVAYPASLGLAENDGVMRATGAYYEPLLNIDQSLAAVDKMIERGWDFQPKLCGSDFSAVEAYHHEKKLFVRSLWWAETPWRHAVAMSLAVALACLLEKEAVRPEP